MGKVRAAFLMMLKKERSFIRVCIRKLTMKSFSKYSDWASGVGIVHSKKRNKKVLSVLS